MLELEKHQHKLLIKFDYGVKATNKWLHLNDRLECAEICYDLIIYTKDCD